MLNDDAFRRMVMSQLETGRHHSVFVNEESNSMLMSVFTATEEQLVAICGRCFSKVFPVNFTESRDVTSVSLHFVC